LIILEDPELHAEPYASGVANSGRITLDDSHIITKLHGEWTFSRDRDINQLRDLFGSEGRRSSRCLSGRLRLLRLLLLLQLQKLLPRLLLLLL
jgi:hypothetical protein